MTTKNRRFVPFSEYGPALPTKGGIKARNQRGHFGETWWGQRWYQLLNEHTEQGRFSRAATYARKGQVTNINIKPGVITACVQGSSKTPYNVTIAVDQMDLNAWHRISREIAGDLRYAGPLLAGIMPRQLEDLFTKHKTELFPNPSTQLHPHCTCPDPYVPCKHITAACLLAVEEFDRDPFLILRTRGIERAQLLNINPSQPEAPDDQPKLLETLPPVVKVDRNQFWGADYQDREPPQFQPAAPPQRDAPLIHRLGNFPFWQHDKPFIPMMEQVYHQASQDALEILERVNQSTSVHDSTDVPSQ